MKYTLDNITNKKRKISIIKKVLTVLLYIIVIPIIIYNICLIVQSILIPNKTPSFLGVKTFVIISGSMEPNLNIGDIVVVEECKEEQLQVGEIISFRRGQTIITHRIESICDLESGREFQTKGDNNNASDSTTVKIEDIEGKVIRNIKGVGKITLFLQNKLVIVFIILVFYIMYAYKTKIEERKMERSLKRRYYEEQKNKQEKN